MRSILQTATTSWNFMWERWLPDFQWRPVRGCLCCNEEFEKAVAEIQHDTYHDGACPLWTEMLVQGELGQNNAGRRAARASSSSSGSSRARSSTSSSPGQVRTRVVACMQAKAPAHVVPLAQLGRLHPLGARHCCAKTHWRCEAQSEYKQFLFLF